MIRSIVGSSLKVRAVVIGLAVTAIGFGAFRARSAEIDSLPEFAPPTVEIQTEALGLSAEEVEQLITVPLEQDLLAGVPWLDTMRSASIPGLSSVELIFQPGTDLLRARQVVQERLTQAAGLPNVSGPPQMLQPLSSTRRFMMIRLSSRTVSPIQMSVLARWTIRPRLLGVPGVANVSIWGQRDRQLQVLVDPARLAARNLTLNQIIETTGNALWASPLTFLEASTPGTGGFIDTANQRLAVQHLQPISTAADLAKVPIEAAGDHLRLGDVAEVVEDHQPLIGDTIFTDGDPGLLLVVEKFPEANTVEVTRGVEAALTALRPGLPGIQVDPTLYRPATSIEAGARDLGTIALIAVALLILALVALLFEWRSALIALTSILASFATAWLVLYARGTTINTMVLVGLLMALVVVVDEAVTDVGTIAQRLHRQRMNGAEPTAATVVLELTTEMRTTMVFATLVVGLAVLPLLFVQGPTAPFLPSIVLSFALAIGASMLVALVVTPAISLVLLPGAALTVARSSGADVLRRLYDRTLASSIRSPNAVFAAAVVVAIAGLAVLPFLSRSPLPSFRDGYVLVDLKAMPGTSLPEMDRITGRIGGELSSLPGVRDVGADIGRAVTSDRVTGVDTAQLWVSIDPAADPDPVVSSIGRVVAGYPGIAHAVRTYSDERIAAVLTEPEHPIVVRLFGEDLGVLRDLAGRLTDRMGQIDGVVRPRAELQPVEPTIRVEPKLRAADRYGIVPGDIRRSAAALLSGIGVGSLFEQQKVFDVVVWGTPGTRASLSSVRDLLIDTRTGRRVRLGTVANVTIAPKPTVIRHQDISRTLDVTANVRGRDVGAVVADVRGLIGSLPFPLEYHAELIDDYAQGRAGHLRTITVLVMAAIGILLLLQAAIGSWRLAAASFVALAIAPAGGIFAALVTGRVLSLGSLVGFFAVLAFAVRTCLALVAGYRRIEREEAGTPLAEVVRRGSHDRSVPVLTSALAGAAALLPFAISGGAAGQEVVHPMVVVILGGLVSSTLLNLYVVPALYLRFGSGPAPEEAPSEVLVVPELQQLAES